MRLIARLRPGGCRPAVSGDCLAVRAVTFRLRRRGFVGLRHGTVAEETSTGALQGAPKRVLLTQGGAQPADTDCDPGPGVLPTRTPPPNRLHRLQWLPQSLS